MVVAVAVLWPAPIAVAQQPTPTERVAFEGTVVGRQADAGTCGIRSVAGWVTVRLERHVEGPALAGTAVRVVVRCPERLRTGRRYRFVAALSRPRRGGWPRVTLPADGMRTVWALSDRLVSAPPPPRDSSTLELDCPPGEIAFTECPGTECQSPPDCGCWQRCVRSDTPPPRPNP